MIIDYYLNQSKTCGFDIQSIGRLVRPWRETELRMRQIHFSRNLIVSLAGFVFCLSAALAQTDLSSRVQVQNTGISALWVLANISYAGMRAQNHPSALWRTLAFLFGLPGTILTFIVVDEGSDRAYGIDLPRRTRP